MQTTPARLSRNMSPNRPRERLEPLTEGGNETAEGEYPGSGTVNKPPFGAVHAGEA